MTEYYDRDCMPLPFPHPTGQGNHRAVRRPSTELSLAAIGTPENLVAVFDLFKRRNGQSPGPDGIRYPDLGRREVYEVFRPVARALCDGTYRPGATRRVAIPKTTVATRTLTIGNIVDRVVAGAVHHALTPLAETFLLDGVHGFRPTRNHLTMLAQLRHSITTEGRWVVVADDIATAYDSVRLELLSADLQHVLPRHPELRDLLRVIIGGSRPDRRLGLDQGCPLSPFVLNVHLHRALDANAHALGANPGNPAPWLRYVDNIVVPCRDAEEGRQVLHNVNQALGQVGLTLKGENGGRPLDLRKGDSAELLGFRLFRTREDVAFRLLPRAWKTLTERLDRAHYAKVPGEAAKAALSGWIATRGPAFRKQMDRTVTYALRLAAQAGFRELNPREAYLTECRKAHDCWTRQIEDREQRQVRSGSPDQIWRSQPIDGEREHESGL